MRNANRELSYSLDVQEYIKELRHVVASLDKVGELEQFFEKNLLVFMNEGWGYQQFLDMVAEELAPYYGISADEVYFQQYPDGYDKGVERWARTAKSIRSLSENVTARRIFGIVSCDLCEVMDSLSSPMLMQALKTIVKDAKQILIVFRLPYMNEQSAKLLRNNFTEWFQVRQLVIPPISIEEMKSYIKESLCKKGFQLEEGADIVLEQWICEKKNFIDEEGYRVLGQMTGELIYQNALTNVYEEENRGARIDIRIEDVQALMSKTSKGGDAYQLLNELVGMSELKAKVKEIVAQVKLQKEMDTQGKSIGKPSMHMLFYGNPGTGKTTLARIVGQIYKQEGLLRIGNFYETTGNYFVEGLVSELMKKTRNTCNKAKGSVLFVDEAYGISVGHSKGNTAEDILPIFVSEMENNRDDMCIIFAGYEDEMERFLSMNSGLKSRFPHILRFPNYEKEELEDIFFQMTEKSFEYEEELREILRDYLDSISPEAYESKEFSNARFIRNLYERVWGKAAYRIRFEEDKEMILKVEDMKAALEEEMFASLVETKTTKRIGFVMD